MTSFDGFSAVPKPTRWTQPFLGVWGKFQIQQNILPYFNTVIRADDCERYLQLVSDTPEFTLEAGDVQSLFQRDVDLERAHNMASKYLNSIESPPFFNSITIALMSKPAAEPDIQGEPDIFGSSTFRVHKNKGIAAADHKSAERFPAAAHPGYLAWELDSVSAMAIDGQHRLKALMAFAQANKNEAKQISVPVIFVITDPELGLETSNKDLMVNPVSLLRKLFIDLNKHAKKVDRTRLLLLDERDANALALQNTLSSDLSFDLDHRDTSTGLPIGTRGECHTVLPLAVVDWHSNNAKVDNGPHLISVLGLDWCLKELSGSLGDVDKFIESAEKARDEGSPADYYETLRKKLRKWIDPDPEGYLNQAISAAEEADRDFEFPGNFYRQVGATISDEWSETLTCLLTNLASYKALVIRAEEEGLLSTEFVTWYQKQVRVSQLTGQVREEASRELNQIEKRIQAREGGAERLRTYEEQHSEDDSVPTGCARLKNRQVKGSTSTVPHLLFSQTGQRSYIAGFSQFTKTFNERKLEIYATRLGVHERYWGKGSAVLGGALYAECLNMFEDADDGLFFTRMGGTRRDSEHEAFFPGIWHGSILKRDDVKALEFSGAAAKRGARMMSLIASIALFQRCNGRRITSKEIEDIVSEGTHLEVDGASEVSECIRVACDYERFHTHDNTNAPLSFLALSFAKTEEQPYYMKYKELCVERIDWIAEQIS